MLANTTAAHRTRVDGRPVIGHLVGVFVQAPRARGDDDTRDEEGLVSHILIRSKINNCYVPRVVTPLSTETHVITAAS
jgi:hypothetical protein